jgi:glyoxylase-like metal-dependent hydrolase (beta-lactamase superfamily II)/rhodanese-related sulfurtransferase
MITIKKLYTKCLSQASYYIESNGEAAVIDPIRDFAIYTTLATERNAQIKYIFETHFHADFISGHLDLQKATGACIIYGPEAVPVFAAHIARHNEQFALGDAIFEVLHTPGHTIESSCFLLYDEKKFPVAVFTGDTLFNGEVGRPDLLSANFDKYVLAEKLYHSLHGVLAKLPDEVLVYPGHGAGSACGKNIVSGHTGNMGEQRKSNHAFLLTRKSDFIAAVVNDLPPAPSYFLKDAEMNRIGYPSLNQILEQACNDLTPEVFAGLAENPNVLVLDVREATSYGESHVPGSIHIGLDGAFAIWAATLYDLEKEILLIAPQGREEEAATRLARVGFSKILGCLKDGMIGWKKAGKKVAHIESIDVTDLMYFMDSSDYKIIDLRKSEEVKQMRLPHALQVPLAELPYRLHEFSKTEKYILYCVSGYRSMIAASILRLAGIRQLLNVTGGVNEIAKHAPQLLLY